ncbi:MAG: hypothetical protein V3U96_02815 [Paracoccaceae bacterium]
MKILILICISAVALAACGADGEPVKPRYTTKTTIGYNSVTGPFNSTVFGIEFGS